MSNKKLIVGCSPMTSKIYAGNILKDGFTWGANRQEVTDSAVDAVAQYLLQKNCAVLFVSKGKRYRLSVEEAK